MIVVPSRAVAVRLGGSAPVTLPGNRVAILVEHVDDAEAPGPTTDPDSDAYLAALAALGITNPTISAATETFCVAVKDAGVWPKLDAVYLIAGGTAAAHRLNLKERSGTFDLTFSGAWVHSATGMLPSPAGSTYADTHYIAADRWTNTDGSLGYYSRTADGNVGVPNYDMGCSTTGDARATIVVCHYWTGATYLDFATGAYPHTTVDSGFGLFTANQIGVTTKGYRNGVEIMSNDNDALDQPPISVYIGANNTNGAAMYFSTKQCAFAYLGRGLTPTEQASLYTLVQAFQTALSRQV